MNKTKNLAGINMHKPPVEIHHRALVPSSPDSVFKRECPFCYTGMLLVRRDSKTFIILAEDRCVLCGQEVKYLDFELIGDPIAPT